LHPIGEEKKEKSKKILENISQKRPSFNKTFLKKKGGGKKKRKQQPLY
jgi:hypothetical protein